MRVFFKFAIISIFTVLFITTSFAYILPAWAEHRECGRVLMVTVDRLTLDDIDNMPVLQNLIKNGGIALLNNKTADSRSTENVCVTVGCGVPMMAKDTARSALNVYENYKGETAGEEYRRRTGWIPPKGSVVQLDIALLKKISKDSPYTAIPGALGTILEKKGLNVAVLGNSDYGGEAFRPAVTIAMNNKGIVRYGKVDGELLVKDASFPGAVRMDYKKLLAALDRYLNVADFIVIDVGDLTRLEQAGGRVIYSILAEQRKEALLRIDLFIGELLERLNLESDLLIVFAPEASSTAIKGNLLTPVIAAGSNIERGYLTSGTTRRSGIIAATDLAPTILDHFGLKKQYYLIGQQVTSTAAGGGNKSSYRNLKNLNERLVLIYNARPPLLKGYITLHLILLFVSLYLIFFLRSGAELLKPFLIFMMSVSLSFLFVSFLPWSSIWSLLAALIAVALIITGVCMAVNRLWYLGPFVVVSLLTALSIIVDLFLGAPLQKQSVFGYDAIAGARFYGLGNEYMGVLIGAAIMGVTLFVNAFPRYKRLILLGATLFFITCLYAIAAPHLGTNVGGTIAASAGFFVTLLLLWEVKLTRRVIFLVIAVVGFIFLLFIAVDLGRDPARQSHIGRNARLILSGGVGEIIKIIYRKLEVNVRLIKYTIWSRFFLASLGSLALLFYRPVGIMRIIRSEHPSLFKGFAGAIVGSIVALVFNDSGIVAAATSMIFIASPLIYLVLFESEKRQQKR